MCDRSMNALLDFSGLPRFAAFDALAVKPAIEQLIAEAEAAADRVVADAAPATWANTAWPLDEAIERLGRAWAIVSHLNAVVNAPALREAYNGMLPEVTQFWTGLSQNEALFRRYRAIEASPQALTPTQRKAFDDKLRDFRLGGAELDAESKARFAANQEAQSLRMSAFNDNVLDATNAFSHLVVNPTQLTGLPQDVVDAARVAAEKDGDSGWKFTLQAPSYLPVMQYAAHHPLREALYRAYVTRASELGADPAWDNGDNIRQLLALRAEEAALLGYGSYAEVSLATKMAGSPREVVDFLRALVARVKPAAENDWRELVAFARSELNMADLQAWDVAYVSEMLRQKKFAFSENEVKQYFPERQVIAGLFRVVESLYGVTLRPAHAETWHPDVRFYELHDASGNLIGSFYFDLYARENKRGGAWMDDAVNRRLLANGTVQRPVALMTCNFPAPVGDRPALFTHDNVITLFHEFGHGLHHLLTEVDELAVSGINGVEWDAVELPSQFMENFCWEWEVLTQMSAHVETGEPLPRALYEKMIAARHFQAGMGFVRQLEFALLDMLAHSEFDAQRDDIMQLLTAVRQQVAVLPYPAFNRMPHAFQHIFGGGYAAGYYSYKWAEVLSADAYAAFEETGILNAETGDRFRREVLAQGGSRPAMESFIAFRGRKPEIEHLLRHNGLPLAA